MNGCFAWAAGVVGDVSETAPGVGAQWLVPCGLTIEGRCTGQAFRTVERPQIERRHCQQRRSLSREHEKLLLLGRNGSTVPATLQPLS